MDEPFELLEPGELGPLHRYDQILVLDFTSGPWVEALAMTFCALWLHVLEKFAHEIIGESTSCPSSSLPFSSCSGTPVCFVPVLLL